MGSIGPQLSEVYTQWCIPKYKNSLICQPLDCKSPTIPAAPMLGAKPSMRHLPHFEESGGWCVFAKAASLPSSLNRIARRGTILEFFATIPRVSAVVISKADCNDVFSGNHTRNVGFFADLLPKKETLNTPNQKNAKCLSHSKSIG